MSNANKLIQSLVGYVNDVKPFHSKLRDFTSELFFTDEANIAVVDQQPGLQVGLQNVWGRLDDERMARLSEGTAADQLINIPPMVLPRFSLNTFLNYGQRPPGNDPASSDPSNTNADGKPDAEVPYELPTDPDSLNHLSQSHQLGSNAVPLPLPLTDLEWTINSASRDATTMTYGATLVGRVDLTEATAFGIPLDNIVVRITNKSGPTQVVGGTLVTLSDINGPYDAIEATYTNTFVLLDCPLPDVTGVTDVQWAFGIALGENVQAEAVGATGRYKVPFHHGSYVEVDNVPQTLLTDYTVDRRRSVIQFLAGHHPASGEEGGADAKLAFNLYSSDRMFVAMASPFDYDLSRAYDAAPYDQLPYDDNGTIYLEADNFVIVVDNAYTANHQPVIFNDIKPGRTKCQLTNLRIYGPAVQNDTWALTAVSDYVLKVQKVSPLSTTTAFAYLNQPFDNGEISFTLSAPWVAYYFDLQTGSYLAAIDQANGDFLTYNWLYDQADFYSALDIKTEHGVLDDPTPPVHAPVLFNTIGHVMQRLDGTYYLQLLDIPPRGTYIEVRVEQNQQYNPRANAGMDERLDIVVYTSRNDSLAFDGSGSQSVTTVIKVTPIPPPVADVGDFQPPSGQRIIGWHHPTNGFNVPYVIIDQLLQHFLIHPGPNSERPLIHWDNIIGDGVYTVTVTCTADLQVDSNFYDVVHNGVVINTIAQGETKTFDVTMVLYEYLEFVLNGPSYAGGGDFIDISITDGSTTWDAYQDFITYLGVQNTMWSYFYRSNTGYPSGVTNSVGPMQPFYGSL